MTKHISVLLNEIIESFDLTKGGTFVDVTLGGGGHTFGLISKFEKLNSKELLKIICFDQDTRAIEEFEERLRKEGFTKENNKWIKNNIEVHLINDNFENLITRLTEIKVDQVNGYIADLGFSTDQLEDERGFSFLKNGKLDMRMNNNVQVTAEDLLNGLYRKELEMIFREYGDMTWEATRVAKGIEEYRKKKKISTVSDLLEIIKKAVNYKSSRHIEARVFQAIRITVNREIDALKSFLPQSLETLAPQGVVNVISFHSGEDKVVKRIFSAQEDTGTGHSKLIYPTEDEIKLNPKASSARLRVFHKN